MSRNIQKKYTYFRIRKINNTVENFHQKLLRPMNFLFSSKKVLCSERGRGKKGEYASNVVSQVSQEITMMNPNDIG